LAIGLGGLAAGADKAVGSKGETLQTFLGAGIVLELGGRRR
jgi:hypothetical protein